MIYDLKSPSQNNLISKKQHLKESYRKRFMKTLMKKFFVKSLVTDLIPVLEPDPDIILAVNRHVIRETVPKSWLKKSWFLQVLKLIEEGFD